MSTTTTTPTQELREAQRRLSELRADITTTEDQLRQARQELTDGSGEVEAVTRAEGRLNALQNTASELRERVERLRREIAASQKEEELQERLEAHRAAGRALHQLVHDFARKSAEMKALVDEIEEAQRSFDLESHELRKILGRDPGNGPEETPDGAFRAYPMGLKELYREIDRLNELREIEAAT